MVKDLPLPDRQWPSCFIHILYNTLLFFCTDDILAPSCSGINHVTFRKEFSEIELFFVFLQYFVYWLLPAQNVLHLYSVGVQLWDAVQNRARIPTRTGRDSRELNWQKHLKSTLKRAIIETLNRRFFMAFQVLTTTAASITELKRDPMGTFNAGEGALVAILNRNEPAFYCVPPVCSTDGASWRSGVGSYCWWANWWGGNRGQSRWLISWPLMNQLWKNGKIGPYHSGTIQKKLAERLLNPRCPHRNYMDAKTNTK